MRASVARAAAFTAALAVVVAADRTPRADPLESRFLLVSVTNEAGQPVTALDVDDLSIQNDGVDSLVVRVTPARYPIALVIDTSSYARTDFRTLQAAALRFADVLAPRDVAVYTSGEPAARIQPLTGDRRSVGRAIERSAAAPNGAAHTLEAILRASRDLAALNAPLTAIVAVSAGGVEMSPPGGDQVLQALHAGRALLYVVEERAVAMTRGAPQQDQGEVLRALAAGVNGTYFRGAGAAAFAAGLDAVRLRLDAEAVVEYAVPPGAPRRIRVSVRGGGTVAAAIDLQR